MHKGKILVIDDEINILKTIELSLSSYGYSPEVFANPIDGLARAKTVFFDLAFIDFKMQPMNGIEVLNELKKSSPDTTVVLMTAHGSIESAVEAIKKGAYDYITKPFSHKEFIHIIERVYEHHRLSKKLKGFAYQIDEKFEDDNFVSINNEVKDILKTAKDVSESNIPILIEGESGTGKEVLARFIHKNSLRSGNPFIIINCSAIPENLFESELFGHVKGAFTNAIKDRIGRLELADTGTVFLDEVAEIPKSMQVKLLRFLQRMEFERVGENLTRSIEIRVISATNRDVEQDLNSGMLRDDFYFRIAGVKLKLPPLRDRKDDMPVLIDYFIKKYSIGNKITIPEDTQKFLSDYDWPGNIRELETVIKRLLVFAKDNIFKSEYLPQEITNFKRKQSPQALQKIEDIEKLHIIETLKIASNSKEAAKILGISETTLWRKRKLYGL
ncbi:MAG: sigma-54-dependent Fis family transcriptional regulator [Melioribacter sp.]|nr:sigma-54-dependent Fis family transcriptional regulator [Melioribacter sp.]